MREWKIAPRVLISALDGGDTWTGTAAKLSAEKVPVTQGIGVWVSPKLPFPNAYESGWATLFRCPMHRRLGEPHVPVTQCTGVSVSPSVTQCTVVRVMPKSPLSNAYEAGWAPTTRYPKHMSLGEAQASVWTWYQRQKYLPCQNSKPGRSSRR